MNAAAFAFTCFWAAPELAADLGILVAVGRVQANASRNGDDTAAGWFELAAMAYTPDDDLGELASRACRLTAAALRAGVAS